MPDEGTAQAMADEPVNNTGASEPAQVTQTETEAQPERTFTQADVDRIVANRIKSGIKAELRKLTGEDGVTSVEDLQRQLSEERTKREGYEAREAVRDYLSEQKVPQANMRAVEKLVSSELIFEDGKPANLEDAYKAAKSLAPALFVNQSSSINGNNGRQGTQMPQTMDELIRRQAGNGI